jgi:hypothetical protein
MRPSRQLGVAGLGADPVAVLLVATILSKVEENHMTEHSTEPGDGPSESLGSPDQSRGGADVEAAVENAEAGSRAEGAHAPFGDEETVEPGQSRGEQLREVVPGATEVAGS